MAFKDDLLKARHHIVFLIGLAAAFGVAISLESWKVDKEIRASLELEQTADISPIKLQPLSGQERKLAEIAWKYFENNLQKETGLVNSVDNYQASTMWDTASYLLALISAYKLELIDQSKFDQRMSDALASLARMPLFENLLPNKSYNTVSLEMVNYQNQKTERGIGWSAIDIGRLMVPFNILVWQFPQHTKAVNLVLNRLDFRAMLRAGLMYGAAVDADGNTDHVQEGRIGYEEYAAKSLQLAGLDVSAALNYQDYIRFIKIYGIKIPTDSRDPETYYAHNYVVSENYILDGLEFGWDNTSREFAYRVFKAQEGRYEDTGILTAVSEDNIKEAPYFVYNTVYTDGRAWNAITEDGADASDFKTLSTKAAFGWHVLYNTDYTRKLIDVAAGLYDPERGFYSGRYEKNGKENTAITANSNAIILESLHYKQFGPLLRIGAH
ncbi:MAG: DUF3131 domain-containing protein [Gammaproteobacteria bacterium]|nr:DUF3131 domain-containing protein [Gammaproteobacteria bacterium]MBU1654483.1 DUF3131 domain-containing protein [Gammaproteobacteria bacterium]MBU1960135.1 DUF3131 domain-containing protein [Gammaproteobacteria bacterium]